MRKTLCHYVSVIVCSLLLAQFAHAHSAHMEGQTSETPGVPQLHPSVEIGTGFSTETVEDGLTAQGVRAINRETIQTETTRSIIKIVIVNVLLVTMIWLLWPRKRARKKMQS